MPGRKKISLLIIVAIGIVAFFLFIALPARVTQVVSMTPPLPPPPKVIDPNADLPPQPHLAQSPAQVKALYATSWSAATEKKIQYFLDLLATTELNAIVIDIKDYSGNVSYEPDIPTVKKYGAYEKRIAKINALIKRFHDAGVYVIGRIAVFQDGALVKARPDLAITSQKTGGLWGDRNGIHWLDTAATPVWDYNIDIAREALARGFDEINFDYIRFPTDGDLSDIVYPYYREASSTKREVVAAFFNHVRQEMPYARISADIFGEAIVNFQETGIGQYEEDTLQPFDAVAPMIYPSHFNPHFLGLTSAAANPYPVIRYAMDTAFRRLKEYEKKILLETASSTPPASPSFATFRPWLQDFDLGATYTAELVRAQITAVDDSARAAAGCPGVPVTSNTAQIVREPVGPRESCDYQPLGWMLWNASNVYTKKALLPEG